MRRNCRLARTSSGESDCSAKRDQPEQPCAATLPGSMASASVRCLTRSAERPLASHQSASLTRAAGSCPAFFRTASYVVRSGAALTAGCLRGENSQNDGDKRDVQHEPAPPWSELDREERYPTPGIIALTDICDGFGHDFDSGGRRV